MWERLIRYAGIYQTKKKKHVLIENKSTFSGSAQLKFIEPMCIVLKCAQTLLPPYHDVS